MVDSNYMPMHS